MDPCWQDAISPMHLTAAIQSWPQAARDVLNQRLGQPFSGKFKAAEIKDFCARSGLTKDELLLALMDVAKAYARPSISGFRVGAVLEGASGDVYLGANLEFGTQPLNQTIHAEQAAVVMALPHEKAFRQMATSAAPCGHCRQFLAECDLPDAPLSLLLPGGQKRSLAELLPEAFTAAALGIKDHPLIMPTAAKVTTDDDDMDEDLTAAAHEAFFSHSPYSRSPGGCLITTKDGRKFLGRAIENAAFNPSINPVQGALIRLNHAGLTPQDMTKVLLVMPENSLINHQDTALPILDAIGAPELELWQFELDEPPPQH